ncbi:hypothetical protein ACHAXM_005297 [Skeletonema potamos]
MAGQSRGKGKALNTIAARSGRDPAAIVDSIQAAEKAQAKAEAAKQHGDHDDATKDTNNEVHNNNNPSQIYSLLSPQEQYRFHCFRRSGFASKPIEKFVAKMLVDEANRRFVGRRGIVVGLGGRVSSESCNAENETEYNGATAAAAIVTDGSDLNQHHNIHHSSNNSKKRKKQSKKQMLQEESKRRRVAMDQPPPYLLNNFANNNNNNGGSSGGTIQGVVPPLDQLVVPNSASEIVAVVSTLAKCYAQRLVSAARRVADAEVEEEQKSRHESTTEASTKTTTSATATVQKPISPRHLLEAHRYRSREGLDPGFWMADRVAVDGRHKKKASSSIRASVGTSEAAALGIEDRTRSCFLAAIAAQDAYYEARTNEVEEEGDSINNKEEVKMDVDKE